MLTTRSLVNEYKKSGQVTPVFTTPLHGTELPTPLAASSIESVN